MHFIYLRDIQKGVLLGTWNVVQRSGVRPATLLAECTVLRLSDERFIAGGTAIVEGPWSFFRNRQGIYNPQLHFRPDGLPEAQAIITKLCSIEQDKREMLQLSLYFDDGFELVLSRHNGSISS